MLLLWICVQRWLRDAARMLPSLCERLPVLRTHCPIPLALSPDLSQSPQSVRVRLPLRSFDLDPRQVPRSTVFAASTAGADSLLPEEGSCGLASFGKDARLDWSIRLLAGLGLCAQMGFLSLSTHEFKARTVFDMENAQLAAGVEEWGNYVLMWIGFGTLVGLLAKAIMPGRDPGGAVATFFMGLGGAFIGCGLLKFFWENQKVTPLSPVGLVVSTAGAFILLFFYRLLGGYWFHEGDHPQTAVLPHRRRRRRRSVVHLED